MAGTGCSSGSRGLCRASRTPPTTGGSSPPGVGPVSASVSSATVTVSGSSSALERERFAGEINLSSVQRGPYQNAYVGYWIDEAVAGNSYVPEAFVVLCRFAFEELGLHRLQASIIPRNAPSHRVAAKVGLRNEGTALRYLEINGVWEDHVRYAITSEDWEERRDHYLQTWILPAE